MNTPSAKDCKILTEPGNYFRLISSAYTTLTGDPACSGLTYGKKRISLKNQIAQASTHCGFPIIIRNREEEFGFFFDCERRQHSKESIVHFSILVFESSVLFETFNVQNNWKFKAYEDNLLLIFRRTQILQYLKILSTRKVKKDRIDIIVKIYLLEVETYIKKE